MTNEETLKSLSTEALSYFSFAYYGSGECRTCIYKDYDICSRISDEEKLSCYEGHLEWLKREPDADDRRMFHMCQQNALSHIHNDYIMAANTLTAIHGWERSAHEELSEEEWQKKNDALYAEFWKYAKKIGATEADDVYRLLEQSDKAFKEGLEKIGGWK